MVRPAARTDSGLKAAVGPSALNGNFVRAVALHSDDLAAALTNGRFQRGVAAYRYWVAGVVARLCKGHFLRRADIRCGTAIGGADYSFSLTFTPGTESAPMLFW
jgi:hypothetical protein